MDRNALSRATEASDSPTPGYLYVDIAKSAAASPTASLEIVQYLIRRLKTKNNPNVKFKCLKVITKTAESAVTRGHFKRAVAQDPSAVAAIKECLQFRGPPDPVRGDQPYQKVQEAAKEALEAVYSDSPSSSDAGAGPGPGTYAGIGGGGISGSYGVSPHASAGGMGGYGSSGGGPVPGGGGEGPRKMEGIGNPMYKDPRLDQSQGQGIGNMSVREMAKAAGETVVAMAKDPLARNVPMGPPRTQSSYAGPPGRNELARATGGEWTMASNRGPNAVDPSQSTYSERDQTYYNARNGGSQAFQWAQQQGGAAVGGVGTSAVSGGVGGSWGSAAASAPPRTPGNMSIAAQSRAAAHGQTAPVVPMGSGGTAASDGTYEKNLVMELCPPGGMKAEPPPEKLAAFLRSVPSLNPDLVCPSLLDALEDGQPWIIKAKALCVIERVIQSAVETNGESNPYSDFFHACSEEIEPLASHNRSAIRDPARRVLKALGIDGVSGAAVAPKAPAAAPAPPVEPPNLLDFDDEAAPTAAGSPTAPPPATAPPPPAPEAAPKSDMFGGLTVQGSASSEPTPAAAAAVPAPAAATGGLFGDMTVKPSAAKKEQVEATEPLANGEATASSPGLFNDVNVKASGENVGSADAAMAVGKEAAGTGSAFGFISGEKSSSPVTSPVPTAKTAAVPPPASPSKDAFDPLLSLGTEPTNEQKVQTTQAQIAQMQAMAMQQNMMMMQQQMQQMQLAMAMQTQQQGGGRSGSATRSMLQMGGPINPNVMRANSIINRQAPNTGDATRSFSFLDNPNQGKKEDTHAFDFVMDSMKTEKK